MRQAARRRRWLGRGVRIGLAVVLVAMVAFAAAGSLQSEARDPSAQAPDPARARAERRDLRISGAIAAALLIGLVAAFVAERL